MDFGTPTRSPLGLLTLLGFKGIGKLTAPNLACSFNSLNEVRDATDSALGSLVAATVLKSLRDETLWQAASESAFAQLEKADKHETQIVTRFDPQYPALLRRIADPPAVLFVKGKLPVSISNVACVGTRQPSQFGAEVARRVVKVLAEHEFGIVSGLAIGIDSESHRQALECKAYTAAILANGLDSIYPRENQALADRILEQGGALISEQPIGTRAFAQNLVQRDRLQSGMSLGTFVFQTDIVGGTMHTVRFTLEQNRELFAPIPTPKFADEEKSRGIRAIVEKTGRELADLIDATGPYRKLLTTQFADRPPATGIAGANQYSQIVDRLRRIAENVQVEISDRRP